MTQNPYDQLSKQVLEEILAPWAEVQRSLEIPGEAKFVDLWFRPLREQSKGAEIKDLLAKIAKQPCLLEPYRNPPSRDEVRSCLLKLFWVQEDLRRKAKQALSSGEMPSLWILATSISKPVLQDFFGHTQSNWGAGIYCLAPGLGTALVSLNELPRTRETLTLRILGRGEMQQQAIADVLALPPQDSQRLTLLRILGNWKVTLELSEAEFEEQESIMALSQAFLEWEQATEQKGLERGLEQGLEQGEKSILLKLLNRKLGSISREERSRIESLSLAQTEALAEALLDFRQPNDLQDWLLELR
ncbi:MAG: DUF4351 domain-containing protein [Thermosynechococcaceae cyanobacterium]